MTVPMKRFILLYVGTVLAGAVGYGRDRSIQNQPEDIGNEPGLVGYWKLRGDCRDYSGSGNHGVNHGVDLERGAFDGISGYIEVPSNPSLKFGTGDFALCAWIYTEKDLD